MGKKKKIYIHYLIQTGALLDMAGHDEAEGVCGKKSTNECEKKNSKGFFFLIVYRQVTVLDWRFSVEPGSYRRPGADRRWVGGCPEAKASR